MNKYRKLLIDALQRCIDDLNSGKCNSVPDPIIRSMTKSVDLNRESLIGEEQRSMDEACEDLGVGLTMVKRLVKRKVLPPPKKLDYTKVSFNQKDIERAKQYARS